jgi:hypothetical protein
MNVSEAVQVFVLIYVLVIAGLFFTARFWSPLLTKAWKAMGFAATPVIASASVASSEPFAMVSPSFRPGAPRPPKLKDAPDMASHDAAALRGYGVRLGLCARIVGRIASSNPTGFPMGIFREWYGARWLVVGSLSGVDYEQSLGEALRLIPEDEAAYGQVLADFSSQASYAEMADLVHFCGQAFAAARAGSPVHEGILALADRFAVAEIFGTNDSSPTDDHEQALLERRLEVDFLAPGAPKVAHLRRMHAFFRQRLIALRDDPTAERRSERMADCRRHMEEHERLLSWLGSSV